MRNLVILLDKEKIQSIISYLRIYKVMISAYTTLIPTNLRS